MRYLLSFFLLLISGITIGQLPVAKNILKAYEKGTRSLDGKPGRNYWQNAADYNMDVRFNPETRLLNGKVQIKYFNRSPDTLNQILFKLYPNLYQAGSTRMMAIKPEDVSNGVRISSLKVNGAEFKKFRIDNTNMSVLHKVMPGDSVSFDLEYSYILNKTSHIRTGEVDSGSDFIAYFFPRIAVYDDIDGWNQNPYLGTQEFYNDFCDFNLSITVPRDYLVWATGDQTNLTSVYTDEIFKRIEEASSLDGFVTIVDSNDLKKNRITLGGDSLLTWKFSAKHVSDMAFAISNHYTWVSSSLMVDSATGRRTRVDAVYNPLHTDYDWVASDARKTVYYMSHHFPKWPFPFSHITVFDGLDQMEYPMMANDNPVADRAESIELTDHEIFHSMFPFYMGINETKYAWMDEGWATLGEWLISPMIDSSIVDLYGVQRYAMAAGTEADLPIHTLSTQQSGQSYFINSYPKPAMGYLFVKDMLGDVLFNKGLHNYIRLWNGKHPIPYDFFNAMNTGTGKNLDWFWKKWFFEDGEPDLAIGKVTTKDKRSIVTVIAKGSKPVPIDLQVEFMDGSKLTLHRTIAVWEKGAREVVLKIPGSKAIKKMELAAAHTPDANPADNVWVASSKP